MPLPMIRRLALAAFLASSVAVSHAQSSPLDALNFLLGTWTASTNANGSADASASGTYTFAHDLNGHALQRTSSVDTCDGPKPFDCQHHDQLTIYSDPSGSLAALYIDSEGHVINYTISTPDATTVVFASQGPAAAPHFKLIYHFDGKVMTGKFQGSAPGSTDFHSYLEWSGVKQ
jgi:hypothetical protein